MKEQSVKSKVLASLLWKFLERGGSSGIQFLLQVVLARLLQPQHFGTIAILSVFIALANILVEGGFTMALVQQQDADDEDFSSVFSLSVIFSIVLYFVIFWISPHVANFYDDSQLSPLLRVLAISIIFSCINSIQSAYISKNMLFKKQFWGGLTANLVSGGLGIVAALLGAGVWTLIIQQISYQLVTAIVIRFLIRWNPRFTISSKRLKELFSFGWKIFIINIFRTFFEEVRTLIIGRIYTSSMLGYYNRGKSFPHFVVSNIDGSIQAVMFPTFSSNQDNPQNLKSMVRRSIKTSSYFIFPAMIGLAIVAEPLVIIVLSEKWAPAIPFLQIFCISYAFKPIQGINLQVVYAMGRSDISLKIFFIKRILELIVLFITVPIGIHAIAIGTAFNALFNTIINVAPNRQLLNYGFWEQINDVFPTLIISLAMGGIIFSLRYLPIPIYLVLVFQVVSGACVYYGITRLFRLDVIDYIRETFKGLFRMKR